MLNFSFSTVLMALLTSSVLIGLITVVFHNENTLACAGYKLLGVFVGLTVIRLIFPFELPFTTNIPFSNVLAQVVAYLRKPQIQILNITVSFWNIFVIIWLVGIIFNTIRYINQYCRAQDYILKYGQEQTNNIKYKTILDSICKQHNKKNNFRVMELPNMNIPIIYGLKNPYIILPSSFSISEDKLYYVFYHEAMHHFHHDFLIKGMIRFFSIIYWWNPAFIILYKQANTLLEIHIDKIITHKEADITEKYAECLLYMKRNSIKCSSQPMSDFLKKESCFLVQSRDKDFKRRLIILLKEFAMPRKVFTSIILTVLFAGIYLASYSFILEANYHRTQIVEESLFVPNADNTYFIQDDTSHYGVYINGMYFETVDSLESYPKGIKIYNQKGELIHEN